MKQLLQTAFSHLMCGREKMQIILQNYLHPVPQYI